MKTLTKYYKSSNSSKIILEQEFTNTTTKQPKFYYSADRYGILRSIDTPDLKGFVEISERRALRAINKLGKNKTP